MAKLKAETVGDETGASKFLKALKAKGNAAASVLKFYDDESVSFLTSWKLSAEHEESFPKKSEGDARSRFLMICRAKTAERLKRDHETEYETWTNLEKSYARCSEDLKQQLKQLNASKQLMTKFGHVARCLRLLPNLKYAMFTRGILALSNLTNSHDTKKCIVRVIRICYESNDSSDRGLLVKWGVTMSQDEITALDSKLAYKP